MIKTKNQIQPGLNDISVAIGKTDVDLLDIFKKFKTWKFEEAFIMDDDRRRHDIGILILPEFQYFFDKVRLKFHEMARRTSDIVPICLGQEGINIKDLDIIGVGWGIQYEESPDRNSGHSTYSSYVTMLCGIS